MPYELNGQTIEADANGYLTDTSDWSEDLARIIAADEEIELTEKHMDVLNYLREEWLENSNQPNERTILKAMSTRWGARISSKELYDLFGVKAVTETHLGVQRRVLLSPTKLPPLSSASRRISAAKRTTLSVKPP